MTGTVSFSCRSARSPSLLAALLGVVTVESVILHLWLAPGHPLLAWGLTALSVLTVLWLLGDYRALGHAQLIVEDGALRVDVGWRASARLARDGVVAVEHVTWRDIPDNPPADYVNVTKPAQPTIMIRCHPPVRIRLLRSVERDVRTIAVAVDDPDGLVMLWHRVGGERD